MIVNNFWKISGAVLLVCFAAWLRWRDVQKKRRIDAADKFRSVVLSELQGYYPTATKWPKNSSDMTHILGNKFPALSEAVGEYSSIVKDKAGFLASWDVYRHGDEDSATGKQDYFQYSGAYFDDDEPPNPQEILKENITRLLSYCEKK